LGFVFVILAFVVALFADNIYSYGLIFLLLGIGIDGFNNSSMNLVIEIAPEDKRPIYTAIQTNLVSFGLFFPIVGGFILKFVHNYTVIYLLSILLLSIGFLVSLRLSKN
jgi:MFS family permease